MIQIFDKPKGSGEGNSTPVSTITKGIEAKNGMGAQNQTNHTPPDEGVPN